MSDHGLLTTVAYKLGRDKPAFYALEVLDSSRLCVCSVLSPLLAACQGSVAIAGAVVRWLQDNLGIIASSEELGASEGGCLFSFGVFPFCSFPAEKLAASVGTSYGCYFVPAFSGLYAPYWEPSARG